jgi:hypothetical protein
MAEMPLERLPHDRPARLAETLSRGQGGVQPAMRGINQGTGLVATRPLGTIAIERTGCRTSKTS